jgi:hypothetical protein
MKKPVGLLLVVVGGILIFQGWSRKDSLAGDVAEMRAKVANKVDGGTRVPKHVYYLAGGVALGVVGAGLALHKST